VPLLPRARHRQIEVVVDGDVDDPPLIDLVGHELELELGPSERVAGLRVTQVRANRVVIDLTESSDAPRIAALSAGQPVRLGFGLTGTWWVADGHIDGWSDRSTLNALLSWPPAPSDRRRSLRAAVSFETVVARFHGDQPTLYRTRTSNLGVGGIAITGPCWLERGERVGLVVMLEGDAPLVAVGLVLDTDAGRSARLRFVGIGQTDQDRVAALLERLAGKAGS